MDAAWLPFVWPAVFLILAELTKGVASEAGKDAYRGVINAIRKKNADKPDVQRAIDDLETDPVRSGPTVERVLTEAREEQDKEIVQQAQRLFDLSPVLRRAQRVAPVLQGAQILWVDNNPDNNIYECGVLRSLGAVVDLARSTREGLSMLAQKQYHAVISDIAREGTSDEGLRFLNEMRNRDLYRPTVFYAGQVDLARGTPPYAFGITASPDELLHYILDILERERS